MIVVSNTSPIINLAAIGHLHLLKDLYKEILVPDAVYEEIVAKGTGQPGAKEVEMSSWIHRKLLKNQALELALRVELDDGEAAAIALAVELKANVLLIDERLGRSVASRFGLNVVGLLGILIEVKQNGLIKAVKPLLDELKTIAGFWISQKLYNRILHTANEQS